jgi:hypothetical protein
VAAMPETPWKINPSRSGFSPKAGNPQNILSFDIQGPVNAVLKLWKLEIVDAQGNAVRDLSSANPLPPPEFTWDGFDSQKKLPPDGNYMARLTVDAGDVSGPSVVSSDPFFVDVTPPGGTVDIMPNPFNPSGADGNVEFSLALKQGAAAIMNWRLFVYDPQGYQFKDFLSEEHRNSQISWDGRSTSNGLLESGTQYSIVVRIFDVYGNEGKIECPFPVAVYGIKRGSVETVRLPDIFFKAYTDDYTDVPAARAEHNRDVLDQLAALLKADAKRPIKIVGHANLVYWNDSVKGANEQRDVLVPLSKKRAEAIRAALVKRGFEAAAFDVEGVGSADPIVPFSDAVNRWKNRRVEFVFTANTLQN